MGLKRGCELAESLLKKGVYHQVTPSGLSGMLW